MGDLFGVETPVERREMDWYSATVQRLYGKPPEWRWWAWEAVGGGTLVTGAVPVSVSANGKPTWPKGDGEKFIVTDAQRVETMRHYEQAEGKCAQCYGHGTRWFGWSRDEGNRYKPCEFCGATGVPTEARHD